MKLTEFIKSGFMDLSIFLFLSIVHYFLIFDIHKFSMLIAYRLDMLKS